MTTVKASIPDDLLPSINAAAAAANQNRSQWLLEAAKRHLTPSVNLINRNGYPLAIQGVLKASNGKLSHLEAEHAVALVINALAAE